ncbi:MAG: membrane protein YdbS with pleckstrin-like domain [Natronomonas sp.]|jgi:membrane protein YdbS with pleckstrin-like domain
MDERDDDGPNEGPFDEGLRPAVTPVDGTDSTTGDEVPDIEELIGPQRTLEPSIQVVWILQGAISAAVFGVIIAVALAFAPVGDPWMGGVVSVAIFLLSSVFAILRYRIWSYQLRTDSLLLDRGVITRVSTVAPYVRIQHVDVRRGPTERAFGLATTVVYTAGSRGADVSIPGLTPERANDLQARLKGLAIAAEGEDAV